MSAWTGTAKERLVAKVMLIKEMTKFLDDMLEWVRIVFMMISSPSTIELLYLAYGKAAVIDANIIKQHVDISRHAKPHSQRISLSSLGIGISIESPATPSM